MKYRIVEGTAINMAEKINELLLDGWRLYGYPFYIGDRKSKDWMDYGPGVSNPHVGWIGQGMTKGGEPS
jgi:hypothetical protein